MVCLQGRQNRWGRLDWSSLLFTDILHPLVVLVFYSLVEYFDLSAYLNAMCHGYTASRRSNSIYLDDYQSWEGSWEVINGVPYAMALAPSYRHQYVSQNIAQYLGELLRDCSDCHALLLIDWRIADDTIVQPDNMVV
jgi:hypothetical protein